MWMMRLWAPWKAKRNEIAGPAVICLAGGNVAYSETDPATTEEGTHENEMGSHARGGIPVCRVFRFRARCEHGEKIDRHRDERRGQDDQEEDGSRRQDRRQGHGNGGQENGARHQSWGQDGGERYGEGRKDRDQGYGKGRQNRGERYRESRDQNGQRREKGRQGYGPRDKERDGEDCRRGEVGKRTKL